MGGSSYCQKIGGADNDDPYKNLDRLSKKLKVDWSYATRKMSLLKYDPLQTKLTDYYELVNEVDLLSRSNPDLMKAFSNANEEQRKMLEISPSGDKLEFKSFFQQIISNVEKFSHTPTWQKA